MKKEIKISYDHENFGDSTIIGTCYWRKENNIVRPIEMIDEAREIKKVSNILNKCTGAYTIITSVNQGICVSTDIVNVYPLCYFVDNKVCYISDDNRYILDKINKEVINKASYQEYKHATFVSGEYTLIEGVRQTEGGKTVVIGDGGGVSERREGMDFADNISREPSDIADVAIRSVERLAKYASGRPIWLALSGGYDSRILAVMLKRIGYSNINTYTYGIRDNVEVSNARRTAQKLDINWEFMEHTEELMQTLYNSDSRKEMDSKDWIRTSLPLADWPPVHELRRQGTMSESSVVVTGHGGGFLAGVTFRDRMDGLDYVSHDKIVNKIIRSHYNKNNINEKSRIDIKRRVSSGIGFDGGSGSLAAACLDRWNLYERQTKHITSCARTFEPYGVSYWFPYFDESYVRFWSDTDSEQRINKKLYKKFINKFIDKDEKIIGARSDRQTKDKSDTEQIFKRIVIKVGLKDVLLKFWHIWKDTSGELRREYDGKYADPRGSLRFMKYERFKELYNGDRWLSSYRAREILGEISIK